MKAAVINEFGTPDKFQILEIPRPEIKEDNDVLIRVRSSSVNPVDWKHRKGNHKLILGSPFPIVLGYDVSGEVVETGKSVSNFKPGDQVYGRLNRKYGGGYAEYAVSSESIFAEKPEEISHDIAASIPLAALTALQALRDKGNIKKGDKVLINGAASGVGHFAVQLAKEFGGICTAISSFRHKDKLEELKPDSFIDYTKEDFTDTNEKFDIIFDVIGNYSFLSCKHLLKANGVYISSLPRLKILVHKLLSVFTKGKKVKSFLMKPIGDDLRFLNKLIQQNKLTVWIDKTFPLDQISKAHEYSEGGHAEGKIAITIKS